MSDLISRESVLDAVRTECSLIIFDSYGNLTFAGERIIEAIKKVPSIEPEKCGDCVSREAAIDAFEKFIHELGIEDEPYNYGEMALSVQNVPPVTPCTPPIEQEN